MHGLQKIALFSLTALLTVPALAVDAMWLAAGSGTNGAVGPPHRGEYYKVVIGWDWPERWRPRLSDEGVAEGYWSFNAGVGKPDNNGADTRRLRDLGINANLRLANTRQPGRWFLDAGFGLHWVDHTRFENLTISTRHQFALLGAIGYQGRRWETAYELYHLSNAGTGSSNPGLNFNLLRIGYRFSEPP